jgi:hypothetical protein
MIVSVSSDPSTGATPSTVIALSNKASRSRHDTQYVPGKLPVLFGSASAFLLAAAAISR